MHQRGNRRSGRFQGGEFVFGETVRALLPG